MSSEKLLIHLNPVQGYNKIFDLGEYNMQLTAFGLIQLAAGTSYRNTTGEFEVALVLLGGKCAVKGSDFAFAEVGGRKSVFDGKPHTVYLPRRTEYEITALTDVDIAYNASPASRDTAKPTVITPEQCRTLSLGRDNFTRAATIMLDETFDSEHFYIGEGMIPSGNWSGYPPHRHDIDNLPEEIDMGRRTSTVLIPRRASASRRSTSRTARSTRPTRSRTTTPSPLRKATIPCAARRAIRCTISGR